MSQSNDIVEITSSNAERYSILILGTLMVIASLFVLIISWVVGLFALVATVLIVLKNGNNSRGKSYLKLNLQEKWFISADEKMGKISNFFYEIDEFGYNSEFVDEYTSANKSTSEEYRTNIQMSLKSGHKIVLFRFQTDTLDPSEVVEDIIRSLKKSI